MFWEIIFNFPRGMKKLVSDLRIYKLIQDAATSPRNAWTGRNRVCLLSEPTDSRMTMTLPSVPARHQSYRSTFLPIIDSLTTMHTHIPRQQQEFQRRLKRDLRKVMLPVIAYTVLPIIGNLFILLPAILPRQFISRHFLQDDSIQALAIKEYNLRKVWFTKIARDFWLSSMIPMSYSLDGVRNQFYQTCVKTSEHEIHVTTSVMDDAGPIIHHILPLIDFFLRPVEAKNNLFHPFESSDSSTLSQPRFSLSLQTLSTSGLYDLARAHGIASSSIYLQLIPNAYLRKRLLSIAQDIVQDDILLIQEGQHFNKCDSLTDEEIFDACLLRGLPINTLTQMRTQLTHHLIMVQPLLQKLVQESSDTGSSAVTCQQSEEYKNAIQTLILFLPAIRYDLKNWLSSTIHQNIE